MLLSAVRLRRYMLEGLLQPAQQQHEAATSGQEMV